ncbi:unnamed protein product, partial [marine sediment metagenome]
IDSKQWLHTGDLGKIDEEGYITITGRIKELFKTSGGKYVSPIPIEQSLVSHQLIDMAIVIAEGKKFTSCLLFPNLETLGSYKSTTGYAHMEDKEFLDSTFVRNEMKKLLAKTNKDLNHWEQIRKYKIVASALTIDAGELTPTMKIRRHVVEKQYTSVIEKMYTEKEEVETEEHE